MNGLKKTLVVVFFIPALWGNPISAGADDPTHQWPAFRGYGAGAAVSGPAVLKLGDDSNLTWRREMPGRSVAAPIVVGDLVVTTSGSGPDENDLFITACDISDGEVRWQHRFRATGRPFHHPTSSVAAPTPVSDGQRIVAFYSSNDLVCLSLAGDLLWYRGLGTDYPKAGNDIGMASSPVIADGTVIVQVECQGDSFVAAIDIETGINRWRIARPAASNWSSPTVIERTPGQVEVVLQSREDVVAVDPANGTELWRIDEGRSSISSPTYDNGILLLPGNELLALNISNGPHAKTGNHQPPEVLWRDNKLVPRNGCVAISEGRLYSLKGSILIAATLDTGEKLWQKRLSGIKGTWASPVIAKGRIYIFDQEGNGAIVHDQGDLAEVVSEIKLDDGVLGSPALAAGRLVLRSKRHLYCFEP